MTAQPLGHLTPAEQDAADERAALIGGLRDAAAFLETHTEVPVPTNAWAVRYAFDDPLTAEQFTAAARAMSAAGPTTIREVGNEIVDVEVETRFGPFRLCVRVPASVVAVPRTVERVEHVLPLELLKLGQRRAAPGEDPAGNWSLAECGIDAKEAAA